MIIFVQHGIALPTMNQAEIIMEDKRKKLLLIQVNAPINSKTRSLFFGDEPFDIFIPDDVAYEGIRKPDMTPFNDLIELDTMDHMYFIRRYEERKPTV